MLICFGATGDCSFLFPGLQHHFMPLLNTFDLSSEALSDHKMAPVGLTWAYSQVKGNSEPCKLPVWQVHVILALGCRGNGWWVRLMARVGIWTQVLPAQPANLYTMLALEGVAILWVQWDWLLKRSPLYLGPYSSTVVCLAPLKSALCRRWKWRHSSSHPQIRAGCAKDVPEHKHINRIEANTIFSSIFSRRCLRHHNRKIDLS